MKNSVNIYKATERERERERERETKQSYSIAKQNLVRDHVFMTSAKSILI